MYVSKISKNVWCPTCHVWKKVLVEETIFITHPVIRIVVWQCPECMGTETEIAEVE
jgi:rubredoxin